MQVGLERCVLLHVGEIDMRSYRVVLVIFLLLLVSACNLSRTPPTPEVLPTANPSASKPVVVIAAPRNGDEVVVGTVIYVTGRATDNIGITRVQLLANEQIVKTVSSENAAGQPVFDVLFDYTPQTTGALALQLIAYRGALASDAAQVNLTVRSNQAQVTATIAPPPGPVVPTINANDPTCRALVNASLNMRTGPGTVYPRITVIAPGTVVPIVGRTPTNDWWQVRYGTTFGWVSGVYTSVYGICTGIPVVPAPPTPTPAGGVPTLTPLPTLTSPPVPTLTPGLPDLVITSSAGPTSVDMGSATQTYSITITNTGAGPTGPFNNSFTGPDGNTVSLGAVSGLDRGQSIVLQATVTFTAPGNYTLQAAADSNNQVTEISEVNNTGSLSVTVT
jgi:uncharacterized protein YraI